MTTTYVSINSAYDDNDYTLKLDGQIARVSQEADVVTVITRDPENLQHFLEYSFTKLAPGVTVNVYEAPDQDTDGD